MAWTARTVGNQQIVEGTPGQRVLERADDVRTLLEACFANDAHALLLYAENLPAQFFDLRSGDAGAILQKLRMYGLRLAVVRSPDLQLSQRFVELLADEQRGSDFRMFDDRAAAERWLCSGHAR